MRATRHLFGRRAAAGAARRGARTRRPGRRCRPALPVAPREPQRTGPPHLPRHRPGRRWTAVDGDQCAARPRVTGAESGSED